MAKDTLNIALQMEPPALDVTSGAATIIDDVSYGTLFEGLVRLSANGQIEGWLAKNWTVSPDGKVYLFNLRDKVTFSDGRAFNAATAAYSLNRARDIHSGNVQQEALSIIDRIETPSSFQLRIILKKADSFFLTLLSLPDCAMVSPFLPKNLAVSPVGTGAFRFQEWQHGKRIQLIARSDYWGKKPAIKTLNFFFISDALAAYAALKTGQIDFFPDFPAAENLQELGHDPRFKVQSFPSEGEVILAFNQNLPIFQNSLLRQAISIAINRPAFVDAVLYGYGRVIGSHFPPQNPDYLDLTAIYPYDPIKAKALLKQAGYPDGLTLTLDLPPSRYATISGQLVVDQLEKIGIHVTLHSLEWTTWLDRVYKKHDFQMTVINHAEPFDYRIYDKEGYYFGYHNAQFHQILTRLDQENDAFQRHQKLQSLQKILTLDAANVFLFQYPHLVVSKADLAGLWRGSPTQAFDLTTAYFTDSQGTHNSHLIPSSVSWHFG
ncbi:ABC transporter substrate-binding protein, partial [Zymomonas mobilis]